MSCIIRSKLKGPDFPAGPNDQIRREQISQVNLCLFIQSIHFRILITILSFFLFFGPLLPPRLFLPCFLLCSYSKNLDGPVVRLDCQIGLRWVECNLGYTMAGGEW